jgi:hypothetical protein
LEHLEPQVVDALGHSVLGSLSPKTAIFTTPNWEYNEVLRQVSRLPQMPATKPAAAAAAAACTSGIFADVP